MYNKEKHYDFLAVGQAVKETRKKQGITREKMAEKLNISSRYLADIENEGKFPSFQNFYKMVTILNISVDEIFYPTVKSAKSTQRRQVDKLLDNLDNNDLLIVESTIKGIMQTKENAKT